MDKKEIPPSEKLLKYHKDGKKPYKGGDLVFCAYSLEKPIRKCSRNHRCNISIKCDLNKHTHYFYLCGDKNIAKLNESDFIPVTVIQ